MLDLIRRHLVVPLRDFIYPPVCLTCRALVSGDTGRICGTCWAGFPRIGPSDDPWKILRGKLGAGGAIDELLSCFLFETGGKMQEVIHHLKYGGVKSLGIQLGEELGRRMLSERRFASADLLVPVPLHKLRQRERGYNQSALLCLGISRACRVPVVADGLLLRTLPTRSQTHLRLADRKENVQGAFRVNPRAPAAQTPRGKIILLVDDVATTGATLAVCAQALREAGAAGVLAATAAIAR